MPELPDPPPKIGYFTAQAGPDGQIRQIHQPSMAADPGNEGAGGFGPGALKRLLTIAVVGSLLGVGLVTLARLTAAPTPDEWAQRLVSGTLADGFKIGDQQATDRLTIAVAEWRAESGCRVVAARIAQGNQKATVLADLELGARAEVAKLGVGDFGTGIGVTYIDPDTVPPSQGEWVEWVGVAVVVDCAKAEAPGPSGPGIPGVRQ